MKALAKCWFTREHQPEARPHKEADGSHSSWCRHCEREIVSWDKARWFLADGFNVTRLAETVGGRFVFLLDRAEECVIARYPVSHLDTPAELDAFMAELREKNGVGLPGSTVELHDSGDPVPKAKPKARRPAHPHTLAGAPRLSASF